MTTRRSIAIPVAAAFCMAAAPTHAQEMADDVKALTTPVSSFEIGIIGAINDTNSVGLYSGVDEMDAFPLLNGRYITRDDETGTWVRIEGNNLGLTSRDVSLEYEHQGDWKAWINYSQLQRSEPLRVFTGLSGIGDNVQFVSGTGIREVDLEQDRYEGEFGLQKRFTETLDVEVSYRREYKEGDRLWGIRQNGSNIFFVTDPVDYWHHEANAEVNYTGSRLQLTGGTLISLFENNHAELGNDTANSRISLPSDNQAYKAYLNGAYRFTPTTQGTFKFSYNLMTQDEDFFTAPTFPGNSRTDLGGEVHNYLGHVGLSSRPFEDLTLRAKVRYERRDDETPLDQFITESSSRDGFNVAFSRDTLTIDGEASYQLPMDFLLIASAQYEDWERSFLPARQASWREDTEEYTGGVRLRRRLTDTLGAEAGYSYAQREGSHWLVPGRLPTIGVNLVDPIHWGDRDRHKVSVSTDWTPTERLALQARVDATLDSYDGLTLGPRDGHSVNASIDANYQIARYWSLAGWVSRSEIFRDQATFGSGQIWEADLTNTGYAVGLGLRGEPTSDLTVGADTQYSYDKNEYDLDPISGPAIADLPDTTYQRFDLDLWGEYKLSARGSVKLGYGFTFLKNDDFGYDSWVFADGTVIRVPDQEIAHVVALSYRYQW